MLYKRSGLERKLRDSKLGLWPAPQLAWARTYYQAKVAAGKKHHTIVRALAFKWIRIMWACWQNQEAYEETRYLRAPSRSGSPFAVTLKKT